MSRFARDRRVFFIEEPEFGDGSVQMRAVEVQRNLWVCTPLIPAATPQEQHEQIQRKLVEQFLESQRIVRPLVWFYTPMALPIAAGIHAELVVYDCMDELSAFHGAPPKLVERERQLFERADLVFTGGQSLYESKRLQHPAVFAFPSSVDTAHFAQARSQTSEPPDQAAIPRQRAGFFGVIDERMDLSLLAKLAEARPSLQIIMIGPTVKISNSSLPRRNNIHYLGGKDYSILPSYIAGWDVALMPFALNAATRFISPTKTLEYLAAGKPIVSTAIRDVVTPYGESGLVHIADEITFPTAVDAALSTDLGQYQTHCDKVLERTSWDKTWTEMLELITGATRRESRVSVSQKGDTTCSTI
jgi:UDP-galactopyranose mutase